MKKIVGYCFKEDVKLDDDNKLIGEFGGYYVVQDIKNNDILIYGLTTTKCSNIIAAEVNYRRVLGEEFKYMVDSNIYDVFEIDDKTIYTVISIITEKKHLTSCIFKDTEVSCIISNSADLYEYNILSFHFKLLYSDTISDTLIFFIFLI